MRKIQDQKEVVKPFLRWAGGKNWFTKYIQNYLPKEINDYHEPFLGGGSIFFFLKSKGLIEKRAFLSDSNEDLINAYQILKDNPAELISLLKEHKNEEEEYYKVRASRFDDPIERAAQFIYLNRTSFNGVYRVNKRGQYNVPYGKRNLAKLYDFDHLMKVSRIFQNTFFSVSDFKSKCTVVEKGDFIFIDPPYTVAHENNGFIQYNQSIFSWENQEELSELTQVLNSKKANFLVTNAYHKSILALYTTGKKIPISRPSIIGGKGAKRTIYKEVLITNID